MILACCFRSERSSSSFLGLGKTLKPGKTKAIIYMLHNCLHHFFFFFFSHELCPCAVWMLWASDLKPSSYTTLLPPPWIYLKCISRKLFRGSLKTAQWPPASSLPLPSPLPPHHSAPWQSHLQTQFCKRDGGSRGRRWWNNGGEYMRMARGLWIVSWLSEAAFAVLVCRPLGSQSM